MASACALRLGTRLNSASARRSLNSGPGAQRTFTAETSEVAQIDLVAGKQLFLEASDCVRQDALHGTLREGRVVVGDVLAKIVQIKDFVNLSRTVSLSGVSLLRLLRARFARKDCNTVINHSGPLPTSPFGGGVLYSAERIAGAKCF